MSSALDNSIETRVYVNDVMSERIMEDDPCAAIMHPNAKSIPTVFSVMLTIIYRMPPPPDQVYL